MKKVLIMVMILLLLAASVVVAIGAVNSTKTDDDYEVTDAIDMPQAVESGNEGEAEEIEQVFELQGAVTEVTDAYFVIETADHGMVQVNFGAETLFEGVEAQTIAVGQFAIVYYNGMMTRSLPPQVFAMKAGVYPVSGEVTELGEGNMTIARADFGDEVIVFLPENMPEIAVGDKVTAYTNGAMTMSLPAQTTALSVVVVK